MSYYSYETKSITLPKGINEKILALNSNEQDELEEFVNERCYFFEKGVEKFHAYGPYISVLVRNADEDNKLIYSVVICAVYEWFKDRGTLLF